MDFICFILLNAVLFIRPEELLPELDGSHVYEILIIACALLSWPKVLKQLEGKRLAAQPVTLCVFGLLAVIALSLLQHGQVRLAVLGVIDFAKVIVYYLLLVANLDSVARVRQFLLCLVASVTVLAILGTLQYHGVINLQALSVLEEGDFAAFGEAVIFRRLRATGIYNDPNDLCLLLLTAIVVCLYGLLEHRRAARFLLVLPMGLFAYALKLTQSRGGLVALVVSLLALFWARFGWRKTLLVTVVLLPLFAVLARGRQARLDLTDRSDTGQQRIWLWSDGLLMMRESPLFGIGKDQYQERAFLVAHNSFVHAFTELGFVGGTLFVGAFYYSLATLIRLRGPRAARLPAATRALRPYLLAIVLGYVVGMMSLSRNYVVPTYMTLGLATAYFRLAAPAVPKLVPKFSARLLGRLAAASGGVLVALYVFVRVLTHWG
jgi:O-antigen ligase